MNTQTSGNSGPGYAKYKDYTVTFEPIAEEVVMTLGGVAVCRTAGAIRVLESRHKAALYLPKSAVGSEYLRASETSTYCPFKGTAAYQSLEVGEVLAVDALWYYPEPFDEVGFISDYFGVYVDRVDGVLLGGVAW